MGITVGTIGGMQARLNASNAAYNMMQSSNALLGLCSFKGNPDLNSLNNAEKQITFQMLNSQLQYEANQAQMDSLDKLRKDEIKRTFSTFA